MASRRCESRGGNSTDAITGLRPPFRASRFRTRIHQLTACTRINEIVHGERAITADKALRLARYFGTTDRFWLNLQARFDLEQERDNLGNRLEKKVRILKRAS